MPLNRRLHALLVGSTVALATFAGYLAITVASTREDPPRPSLFHPDTPDHTELRGRVARLEVAISEARQFQYRLVELIQSIHDTGEETGSTGIANRRAPEMPSPQDGQWKPRSQLLEEAGFAPDRVAEIIALEKRFNYERRKILHELHHQGDESSPGAHALQARLDSYTPAYRMLEGVLAPDEMERYLEATGNKRQFEIIAVTEGSSAAGAGLQRGDKILSYNGKPITDARELSAGIRSVAPGKTINMEVLRRGHKTSIPVPSGPLGVEIILSGAPAPNRPVAATSE
ncbi:PDZ domain-containing protein [Microbulbifer sediminum]|uniref:PDZ domain-containing protein n=1 Tax=Microbulbifer sediminum TaxID=2904250 RepID=UPI001F277406|nr:PDZ domain-containing protein [Microbulbifer sediminum]